jgi:hypothetical protein
MLLGSHRLVASPQPQVAWVYITGDKNKNSNNAWEEMKARLYSKGKTSDPNDILALQGDAAKRAGFGIGYGLDYEVIE